MKRALKMLTVIFIMIVSIFTTGMTAFASQAETPKKEYIRNGVPYRLYSVLLKDVDPGFYEFLNETSKELFDEEPIIYVYIIEDSMNSLAGFQETYEDGSRAVYLKVQGYASAIQVFIHEMVHYKYDFEENVFYKRDTYSRYMYKDLMEKITDEIAMREYSKLTKDVKYKKAYTSEIFEKIIEEDTNNVLISLYKGEYNLENSEEAIGDFLMKLQNAATIEAAQDIFQKLKKEVDRCPIKVPVF